jgi:predicted DCC family thiol-disulfide oxidoreductase YuxK
MEARILAYDADCGPCATFKAVIKLLDVRGKLTFIPLVEAEEQGLLSGIQPDVRHQSFHLIAGHDDILSGAAALPRLAGILSNGRPIELVVTSFPGVFLFVSFVYRVFSRSHDSGSCNRTTSTSAPNLDFKQKRIMMSS